MIEDITGKGPVDKVFTFAERNTGEKLKRRVDQIKGIVLAADEGSGL